MIVSRCAAGFLILCLPAEPAYALPAFCPTVDPSKRVFTHDANGNLTEELVVGTGGKTFYAYDALSRLTGVSSLRGGGAPEAISFFSYDGEGKKLMGSMSAGAGFEFNS